MPDKQNPGSRAAAGARETVIAGERDNPEAIANRAPNSTPQARWRARNPLKHWAHSATRTALRLGLIAKEPCAVCGACEAEAHHPDHLNHLAVVWLCRAHHKALHTALRRAQE